MEPSTKRVLWLALVAFVIFLLIPIVIEILSPVHS
jgi:hypothetical protein